jgi:hypothetical protein
MEASGFAIPGKFQEGEGRFWAGNKGAFIVNAVKIKVPAAASYNPIGKTGTGKTEIVKKPGKVLEAGVGFDKNIGKGRSAQVAVYGAKTPDPGSKPFGNKSLTYSGNTSGHDLPPVLK